MGIEAANQRNDSLVGTEKEEEEEEGIEGKWREEEEGRTGEKRELEGRTGGKRRRKDEGICGGNFTIGGGMRRRR